MLSTATDGAGPYMINPSATVAGSSYTYVPNPYYYNKSAIHFSKIVISVIGDASTALNALKAGQIAYTDGSFSSASSALASGLTVHAAPTAWSGIYLFDRNGVLAKPLGSQLVRQALNYATDRPALTATLFGQYGTPTDEISLPVYSAAGYVASWENHYPYNVATAKALLAKAGYPNGFTIEMAGSNDWGDGINEAQAIASQWSKVGVNVQIKTFPALTQMLGPWQAAQLPSLAGSYYPVPMYVEATQILVKTAGLFNPWKVDDPVLTALVTKADNANSVAASASDWAAVEKRVIDLAWFVPIARTSLIYFSQPWLKGVSVQANCCPDPVEFYRAG
jgi:peptide/nickel transport system substrate-binding protein